MEESKGTAATSPRSVAGEPAITLDRSLPVQTIAVIAAALQLSERSTYERARRGELPGARRLGRAWRVSTAEFLRWLDGNEQD